MMPQPRLILGGASDLFEDGVLVDEPTRQRIERFMTQAASWAARFMDSGS